jgi:hypothetical protein
MIEPCDAAISLAQELIFGKELCLDGDVLRFLGARRRLQEI